MKKILLVAICLSWQCIQAQPSKISESSIPEYFKQHPDSLNPIEGMWDVTSTKEYYHHDTLYDVVKNPEAISVAIISRDGKLQSYNLSGSPYEAEFVPTDVKGVYLYRIYFPQSNLYSASRAVISKSGEMEYTYDYPEEGETNAKSSGLRVVSVIKWRKKSNY